jgi:hypothetical protein
MHDDNAHKGILLCMHTRLRLDPHQLLRGKRTADRNDRPAAGLQLLYEGRRDVGESAVTTIASNGAASDQP